MGFVSYSEIIVKVFTIFSATASAAPLVWPIRGTFSSLSSALMLAFFFLMGLKPLDLHTASSGLLQCCNRIGELGLFAPNSLQLFPPSHGRPAVRTVGLCRGDRPVNRESGDASNYHSRGSSSSAAFANPGTEKSELPSPFQVRFVLLLFSFLCAFTPCQVSRSASPLQFVFSFPFLWPVSFHAPYLDFARIFSSLSRAAPIIATLPWDSLMAGKPVCFTT